MCLRAWLDGLGIRVALSGTWVMSLLGEVNVFCVLIDYGWSVLAPMNGDFLDGSPSNVYLPASANERETRVHLLSSPSSCFDEGCVQADKPLSR